MFKCCLLTEILWHSRMSAGTFSRSVTFTDRVMWLDGAIVIALVLQTRGCWLMFSHWPFQCHFKAGKVTTGLTESNSNLLLSLLLLLHLGCVFFANKCITSLSSPKGPECTLSCYVPPPISFIFWVWRYINRSLTCLLSLGLVFRCYITHIVPMLATCWSSSRGQIDLLHRCFLLCVHPA